MTLIQAKNLSVVYRQETVLRDVDFAISAGEIVTIVGPNGSGKSTLIRALLGIIPTATGILTQKLGLRIGYVPQKLSIDENLPLPVARFLSLPKKHSRAEMAEVCQTVGATGLLDKQMTSLSGGQFQRVLLARALLGNPHILILDEPTQALDQPGVASFYKMIEQLRQDTGCAVLLVSHDLHVVMSASDRVICLNGHVCCEGTPEVVSESSEYQTLFGIGTGGALALYRHEHDHDHHHDHESEHDHAG